MERPYYSQRNNLGKMNTKIDLTDLKKLFYTLFIRKVWFNTPPQTCLRLCGGSNKATPTKIWY
ncbi:MAG: hypothetical protein LBL33_03680 [Tannerella sp.]|jgi:hypothetical protein|nr:hypothetical protein [Tannerella sp.]